MSFKNLDSFILAVIEFIRTARVSLDALEFELWDEFECTRDEFKELVRLLA